MRALFLIGFLALTACGESQVALPDSPLTEQEAQLNEPAPAPAPIENTIQESQQTLSNSEKAGILAKYPHLDPERIVPTALLEKAVIYFDTNKSKIANKNYISVIDFSKKSSKPRFFVVDMKTGAVWAVRTSHGKGSDANHDGFAEKFSNVSGSNASSLGIYKTAETYQGGNGYSLRLDGMSSTNSNARRRLIVIHGANYVQESNVIQGRSSGCPAVDHGIRDKLINRIKGGSVIFAGLSGEQ